MNDLKRKTLVGLFVLGGLVNLPRVAWAARPTAFDPDSTYTVTYEAGSTQSTTAEGVKILDVVTIGSKEFLVVELGLGTKKRGYINLEAVRTIVQR